MKKRKPNNTYNFTVVKKIAEMMGFSESYVRKILKGDRTGVMANAVKKKYQEMVEEIDNTINNFIEKQTDL